MHQTNPITESVWAARCPSLWTRKEGELPRVVVDFEPKRERKVFDGPAHKLDLDVELIITLRRQGMEWREIGKQVGCSMNTARARVKLVAPELMRLNVKRTRSPRSEIVIRTKADAIKTARIQGTGVAA